MLIEKPTLSLIEHPAAKTQRFGIAMAILAGADFFPGRVGIDGAGYNSGESGAAMDSPVPSLKGPILVIELGY